MEVLHCPSVRHFEESSGPQEKCLMDKESSSPQEKCLMDKESSGPQEKCCMDNDHVGPAHSGLEANYQNLSNDTKDCKKAHDLNKDAPVAFENSYVITIEKERPCEVKDVESSSVESKWTEKDTSLPIWVKCGDKWQVGVKCERADWTLDTVKAKPNHGAKNYIVVFFPHTRDYSWVDTLLVRPISECPQPTVHSSHEVGLQMVKDLAVARQFIMQKLVVDILDIIDRSHFQVFTENARNVNSLKEYVMEAAQCKSYPDMGRILVKLQKMFLQQYIDGDWLRNSVNSWVSQCEIAPSADAVELLKEELDRSIAWKEINSVEYFQEIIGHRSEWKIFKDEVIKLLSTSAPTPRNIETEQACKRNIDKPGNGGNPLSSNLQISRKRPKLEIRRAEAHTSLLENEIPAGETIAEIDSEFFAGRITESPKPEIPITESAAAKDVEMNTGNGTTDSKSTDSSASRSRKCKAYIEAKGRQCVRWANEGDEYCCVHLTARFSSTSAVKATSSPPADAPLCGGTTTLGTRCKHRSLPGSSFCKKHRPRDQVTKSPIPIWSNQLKRKHRDLVYTPESAHSKQIILSGEDQRPLCADPISILGARMDKNGESSFPNKFPEHFKEEHNHHEVVCCIGLGLKEGGGHCPGIPKRHSLYCENHIPQWLKRARNGKSRIISKEVFMDLLKSCSLREQKLHLHKACELFYKLFKSILSMRNQVPREIQFQWVLSEASKDAQAAMFLTKLVSLEKARIRRIWGFGPEKDNQISSSVMEEHAMMLVEQESDREGLLRCKFCSEEYGDLQELGSHFIENHNKEAQWYFRGYACAICLDSFTNRKVLESHVQDRHHAEFSDHCMLFRCIPCGSHFGNSEELWSHVLASHSDEFRQTKSFDQNNLLMDVDSTLKLNPSKAVSSENTPENQGAGRKFICKFCGLKFDLLPDLGRHHQAAHMRLSLASGRPSKKGVRYYAYRLKSGRLTRPKFKKGIGGVSYRLKSKVASGLKKRLQESNALGIGEVGNVPRVKDAKGLGRLSETECLFIAKTLFSEAHKTKARPNNNEILSIARSSCCKVNLQSSLENKFGALPKRLYLKAAKLCSEHNIQVNWHQEGFVCPRGCREVKDQNNKSLLLPSSRETAISAFKPVSDDHKGKWEKDECHYVINANQLRHRMPQTNIILCDDISFGKEIVPIGCIIDKNLLDSLHVPTFGFDGKVSYVPWERFSYVTKPVLDPSLCVDNMKSVHLECGCEQSVCSPGACDHVYLFNTDYEDAKDINGQTMLGRFPYNENAQIILEDGHVVYECNYMCKCSKNCLNRILQNGVRVKLEVFKTMKRGWGVRAGESISQGTFICELIGEVVDEQQANERRRRYGESGCNYFYSIGAQIEKMGIFVEEKITCIIDASKYGNVSRFINHSCSPNLTSRLVLVESMDYQLAHIGLYAARDVAYSEELTFDYAQKLQPGEGQACFCGSLNCKGRLC